MVPSQSGFHVSQWGLAYLKSHSDSPQNGEKKPAPHKFPQYSHCVAAFTPTAAPSHNTQAHAHTERKRVRRVEGGREGVCSTSAKKHFPLVVTLFLQLSPSHTPT